MTRRKIPSELVRPMPPNLANYQRKLEKFREDLHVICDRIDAALEHMANAGKDKSKEASR